ncbi:hypothetical protein J6590_049897 [Homalodisca vitripennis]|nr:hypothetical protein J6590_049897 [Homalodisca vitripennis]
MKLQLSNKNKISRKEKRKLGGNRARGSAIAASLKPFNPSPFEKKPRIRVSPETSPYPCARSLVYVIRPGYYNGIRIRLSRGISPYPCVRALVYVISPRYYNGIRIRLSRGISPYPCVRALVYVISPVLQRYPDPIEWNIALPFPGYYNGIRIRLSPETSPYPCARSLVYVIRPGYYNGIRIRLSRGISPYPCVRALVYVISPRYYNGIRIRLSRGISPYPCVRALVYVTYPIPCESCNIALYSLHDHLYKTSSPIATGMRTCEKELAPVTTNGRAKKRTQSSSHARRANKCVWGDEAGDSWKSESEGPTVKGERPRHYPLLGLTPLSASCAVPGTSVS